MYILLKYYKLFWKNGLNFKGRASVAEYWWPWLMNFLIAIVLGMIINASSDSLIFLRIAYSFITIVPGFALTIRRFHDSNKSGFYLLLFFVPFVGWIWILYLLIKDGDPAVNDYGENPKMVLNSEIYSSFSNGNNKSE